MSGQCRGGSTQSDSFLTELEMWALADSVDISLYHLAFFAYLKMLSLKIPL